MALAYRRRRQAEVAEKVSSVVPTETRPERPAHYESPLVRRRELTEDPQHVGSEGAEQEAEEEATRAALHKASHRWADVLVPTVVRWARASPGRLVHILVAVDVGASNVRVQLSREADDVVFLPKMPSKSVQQLLCILRDVLDALEDACASAGARFRVQGAAIAVAAPVEPDSEEALFTNYDQEDCHLQLKALPPSLFPPGHTFLLNDLEAACFGMWSLTLQGRLHDYFQALSPRDAETTRVEMVHGNNMVLAAGTGLGSGMVSVNARGTCHVVPMEGGHGQITTKGFAREERAEEEDLLRFLGAKWKDQHFPEFEDVCSGEGLTRCYEWVAAKRGASPSTADPAFVAEEAKKGSQACREALLLHYRFLMRSAQQQAVVMKGSTVFLAGDNIKFNLWFLHEHWEELMAEYLDHSRPGLGGRGIRQSTVFVQCQSLNFNVEGARFVAAHGKE